MESHWDDPGGFGNRAAVRFASGRLGKVTVSTNMAGRGTEAWHFGNGWAQALGSILGLLSLLGW